MKPCAFTEHSLIDHIRGTVKIVRERYIDEGYHIAISSRLCIEPDEAEEILIASSALHDIGKSCGSYQAQFRDDCTPQDPGRASQISFIYHEILSASAAYKYAEKRGWLDQSTDLKGLWKSFLLIFSVANHMHTIRDYGDLMSKIAEATSMARNPGSYIAEYAINKLRTKYGSPLDPIGVEALSKELYNILGKYGLGEDIFREIIGSVSSEVTIRRAINFIINYLEDPNTSKDLKLPGCIRKNAPRLYVLILAPLSVGDNCDSYEKREKDKEAENRRAFIRELCGGI